MLEKPHRLANNSRETVHWSSKFLHFGVNKANDSQNIAQISQSVAYPITKDAEHEWNLYAT